MTEKRFENRYDKSHTINENLHYLKPVYDNKSGDAFNVFEMVDLLNEFQEENEQLKKENKELRQDNDIKFWKLQCLQSSNNNQVMLFELSRAIQQGYKVSDKFKQYLDEIKEHNKEIREKHKRLFE